jgi:hypothetical protein
VLVEADEVAQHRTVTKPVHDEAVEEAGGADEEEEVVLVHSGRSIRKEYSLEIALCAA